VPPNSPASRPAFLRLYFSPTLDAVQEEGGWIFVRDADAFAAIKVVAGGHTWSGVWRHSDAATFNAKGFLTPTDVDGSFLLLKSPTSPVITLASDAADYGHDFAAFKAAVQAQPVHWADGVLRFATITFHGPTRAGEIYGRPVNLAPARGYDSPFIRSAWNSGLIHLRHGNATALLDFRNPDNPVKTIGVAVTDAFPPGRGSDQPIRFSRN
jgi:hypothetical protein